MISSSSLFRALTGLLCFACVLPTLPAAGSKNHKPAPEVRGTKVNGVYQGYVEIWSTPDSKEAAGHMRNGQPDGVWTFWDSGGTKVVEVTYRNGTFFGPVTMWLGTGAGPELRGKLKMRGSFDDGMWQGSVLTYYPDGRDRCERVYHDNIITAAYAYTPRGEAMIDKQAMQVAAKDELQDNAFVDAIDALVRRWAVKSGQTVAQSN